MTPAEIGKFGEQIAARYLQKNGYKILEKNKHLSHNEIDIIAANKEYLLFVEVKTRSARMENDCYLPFGPPSSAVDYKKQKRLICAAHDYLRTHNTQEKQPRMDVIEVYLDKETGKPIKIHHIPNAFGEN